MADQYRKDHSGGGQATGKTVPAQDVVRANGPQQTDNGTGAGTTTQPLKPTPGVR